MVAQTRLLSAHSIISQTCQWWTIACLSLCIALLGAFAITMDAIIVAEFPLFAIILFGVYEGIMFLIIVTFTVTSIGGITFQNWSAASIWAFVLWFIIDIPGIVAVLTGLDGALAPLIAQLVVEAILLCAASATEDD